MTAPRHSYSPRYCGICGRSSADPIHRHPGDTVPTPPEPITSNEVRAAARTLERLDADVRKDGHYQWSAEELYSRAQNLEAAEAEHNDKILTLAKYLDTRGITSASSLATAIFDKFDVIPRKADQ